MKLIINKDRSVIPVGTWGTVNENDYEILDFEFPAELDEYNKRIVYYLGDERVWDAIVNNKAYITNAITTKGDVKAYVWCTKENTEREADTDFRTMLFDMHFYENDNADGIVPTPEQVDGFNTMLTAMNNKIAEVNALEQTIETAEAQRQENEETRQENESTRQENEQTRQEQEAERERRTDEAIGNIEDKTAEYNANAEAKTNEFNQNATQKTNDFNSNYTQKVNDFNSNATTQKTDFDSNASSKTSDFNSNAETKTNAFNTNATNKTNAFNSNATEKTSEFNTNAESKTSAFNDNASQKTTNFDNNASEKTDDFNTNARNKIDEYDEHIVEYQAQIDELQEEVEELSENMPWDTTEQATEISVDDAAKYSRNKLELFGNTSQDSLPTGYVALDYIESTGTQYIDTGIYLNQDSSVEIEGNQIVTNSNSLFGVNPLFVITSRSITASVSEFRLRYNNITRNIGGNVSTKSKISLKKNNGYLNNELVYTFNEGTFSSDYTAIIFGRRKNDDGGIEESKSSRIYYCKIWDSNTLVRDFVPCKNPNNEVGLYDFVSQTFFGNAGTGDFVAGNEVTIPNPDYPQDIHVVSGSNTIEVQGENLIFNNLTNQTINGVTFVVNSDKSVTINGTASATTQINLLTNTIGEADEITLPAGTYTLQGCPIGGSSSTYKLDITNNGSAVITDYGNNVYKRTFEESWAFDRARIVIQSGTTVNNLTFKPMLVKGNINVPYVPYYHADYPINLGSLELCKIGDYQDYLYKENGNWYKYGAINKVILDGTTERWGGVSTSGDFKRIDLKNTGLLNEGASRKTHLFCSISRASTVEDYNIAFNYNNVIFFYLPQGITTGNEWKALLSQKLPKLYYILATPTTTQITDETLISQLEAIYNHLALVKGTNHITITPSDLAPYVTLNYMQDLPSKLDNLDSRLSLLE